MVVGWFSTVQWGHASTNHMLFVRVSLVSSLRALRDDFSQPLEALLRSECSRFPRRCISRTGSQGWVSCEGSLRPRPHCSGIVRGEGAMADFCASAVRIMTWRSGMCFFAGSPAVLQVYNSPIGSSEGGGICAQL